jgi:ClpP class serine protease
LTHPTDGAQPQAHAHLRRSLPPRAERDPFPPALATFGGEDILAIEPSALGRQHRPSVAAYWGGSYQPPPPFQRVGAVAVVSIDGPLEYRAGGWWESYETVRARFEAALGDPNTEAVVLRICSPGGYTSGLFETVRAMRKAKDAAGKPVVAYADESIYSAAYALACVADQIFLPETGGVGSIGTLCTVMDWTAMNEKDGLNVVVLASGERKADGNPNQKLTDAAIARFQGQVDALAGVFAALVADARKMTPAAVMALQAGTFLGKDAVAAKIADGVTSWDDLLRLVESKTTTNAGVRAQGADPNMTTAVAVPSLIVATLAAMCALPTAASEAEVLDSVRASNDFRREVLAAAEAKNLPELLGFLAAWKESAKALTVANTKITELEAQIAETKKADEVVKKTALIAKGKAESKLAPSLYAWAETQSVEALTAYLEKAPVNAALANADALRESTEVSGGSSSTKGWDDYSASELHALHNDNPALYATLKADHARRA